MYYIFIYLQKTDTDCKDTLFFAYMQIYLFFFVVFVWNLLFLCKKERS